MAGDQTLRRGREPGFSERGGRAPGAGHGPGLCASRVCGEGGQRLGPPLQAGRAQPGALTIWLYKGAGCRVPKELQREPGHICAAARRGKRNVFEEWRDKT